MRNGFRKADWELRGAELAQTGSAEQVEFFRGFLKECLTWGTHLQVERQFAFINQELTEDEREMMKMVSYVE